MSNVKMWCCHVLLIFHLWNSCGIPCRPSRTWSLHTEEGVFIALVPHETPSCCGVYSVSLPRVPAARTRHLCGCHLAVEASPLLFALPGALRCGRNRVMLKALCPPPSLKLHLLLIQLLNKAAVTRPHCSWCSEKSQSEVTEVHPIFLGMKLEMLLIYRQWVH